MYCKYTGSKDGEDAMSEGFDVRDQFEHYTHIGYAVRDLDRYVKRMTEVFGYKVANYGQTPDSPDKRYNGEYEDFAFRLAFIYRGDQMLELLEPIRGRNVISEYLEKCGEGLHHLNYNVHHYDEVVAHMKEQGYNLIMEGTSFRHPGHRWSYFDTMEDFGYDIELFELYEGEE